MTHNKLVTYLCHLLSLSCLALLLCATPASAAVSHDEGKVKLLVAVLEHTTWPEEDRVDRFVIGLYGLDRELLKVLRREVDTLRVRGKPVVASYFRSLNDAKSAHILLVSPSKNDELASIVRLLQSSHTLVVTDGSDDQRNIMLNFTHPTDTTLAFEVNRSNIVYAGLLLSKEILLFGGTELDAATIYKETEAELAQARVIADRQQQELEAQLELLAQQQKKIQQQGLEVEKKERELAKLERDLARIQANLAQSESLLQANDAALKQNAIALKQKESVLAEKEASIADYSARIEQNQQLLEVQQAELEERERLIADKNRVLKQQVSTIENQQLVLIVATVVLLLVLTLIVIIFRSYRSKNRLNLQLQSKTGELEVANEKLRTMTDAKSKFLSTMSHEIRTPMNGVIGMAELLEGTELNAQQAEYVSLILKSADTLLSLINDILDFSKIEAGKLDLEVIPFNVRDVLGDTLQALTLRANEKGLELAFHIPPEVPERLSGDPVRLRQIVMNLVGNAIKFTESGEIVVDLRLESSSADHVRLGFEIRDTGVGISAQQQQKIFKAFGQADSSTTRQFGGTGLGLSIASQLVALMGGEMTVTSELGQGSTFAFSVNLELPAQPVAEKRQLADLNGQRVLIVDDNNTNQMILEEIIVNWGMLARVVDSGTKALTELDRAASDGQPFSLALLDMMMPGMDGLELVRQIRERPEHGNMRIVMLSSDGNVGDEATRKALDISRTLLKPAKHSDLLVAVTDALGVATAEGKDRPVSRERPDDIPARRVLLVEDGAINQKVAIDLLTRRGHSVELAQNGQEAVDALLGNNFDLVLMDVEMPVMDGLTATRRIREQERSSGAHIPIVAMTASATVEDRERCFAAGMDDFLTKPFRTKELFRAVEALPPGGEQQSAVPEPQPQSRSSAATASAIKTETTTPAPAVTRTQQGDDMSTGAAPDPEPAVSSQSAADDAASEAAASEPAAKGSDGEAACLDWEGALNDLEGDTDLLLELAGLFLEQSPELEATIDAAIEHQDAAELRRAAHTMKGSAHVVGAQAVAAVALELENLAREGRLEAVPPVCQTLKTKLSELDPALREVIQQGGSAGQE